MFRYTEWLNPSAVIESGYGGSMKTSEWFQREIHNLKLGGDNAELRYNGDGKYAIYGKKEWVSDWSARRK